MAAKIKKGDKVIVLAGKDKGRQGDVLSIVADGTRAVVSGVNIAKRHTKQTASTEGGVLSKSLPIHISNLALRDPKDGKATRVGFKLNAAGKKVRMSRRTGEVING
jgi:large subunit ribosomal protein L24